MSDFTATRQYSYVGGALIDENENNTNENNIFDKHNNAFHATTGHGHTGATGDAKKLDHLSLNLADDYSWSGNNSFGAGTLTLNGPTNINGTPNFLVDTTIATTKKLFLGTGTSIYESVNGFLSLNASTVGINRISPNSLGLSSLSLDILSSTGNCLALESSSSGSNGPVLTTFHNSSSPAGSDVILNLANYANNSSASNILYSRMLVEVVSPTAGAESSLFLFQTRLAGALATKFIVGESYVESKVGMVLPAIDPPLANQANMNSILKGWATVTWNGTAWVSTHDYNVSSITSTNSQAFTINWDTDFAAANYPVIGSMNTYLKNLRLTSNAAGVLVTLDAAAVSGDNVFIMAAGVQ